MELSVVTLPVGAVSWAHKLGKQQEVGENGVIRNAIILTLL
jgi:hypothetical protein